MISAKKVDAKTEQEMKDATKEQEKFLRSEGYTAIGYINLKMFQKGDNVTGDFQFIQEIEGLNLETATAVLNIAAQVNHSAILQKESELQ